MLRTRIVSVAEFLRQPEEWKPAVEAEMKQLFEEKKALTISSLVRLQEMKEAGIEVDVIPSKLVITMKPGPRRKVRIVACGNYVEFKGEELYAAGADSAALRLLLKSAAEGEWNLLTVDVKVAFLNAPLVTSRRDGLEEAQVFALNPPSLLLRLGYAKEDEVWIAEKAMYGLRQSPRSWSIYRDTTLQEMSIEGLRLRQTTSEPNLWVVEDLDQKMVGLILVYVDDLLISGCGAVPERILQAVRRIWDTSEPERIQEGSMSKFLGMELKKEGMVLKATQTSFIQERLITNLGEDWEEHKGCPTPCGREIMDFEEETDVTPEQVKEAQRIVGELLWLVTRSRMDLMYVTAKLARWVLRAPRMVSKLSKQVWGYLRRTLHQGLLFLPDPGKGWAGEPQKGLEAFSDASFAPGGQHSIGAVVIQWNGAPMMWRAGKQPFPTMSAAESELTEATEAMLMGDAFDALVSDVFGGYPKSLLIDNQAAIQLISEESGAWRTRHLRLRANHLRWRISRMDWRVNHCPGERMLADLGTKPLAAQRFEDLKTLCGMSEEKEESKVKSMRATGTSTVAAPEGLQQALRMITIATLMGSVASQEEGDTDGRELQVVEQERNYINVVVLVILLAAVVVIPTWLKWTVRACDVPRTRRTLMVTTFAVVIQMGSSQGSDEENGGGRRLRDEDSTALFFLMAIYTFLVILVVMILQRFAQTFQNLSMTPEERRRRDILETERELREAEDRADYAAERLKRLREGSEDREEFDSTGRSSRRSQYGSSSRRRRSLADDESVRPNRTLSSEEGRQSLSRDLQEIEERDHSPSTRSYRSHDTQSLDGSRFTAFPPGQTQDPSPVEESGEGQTAEHTPILPEPSGEGIYAEQARRTRRRFDLQDPVPEGDDYEEEECEGDEMAEEVQGDQAELQNVEQGEEEHLAEDPEYSPTSEATPDGGSPDVRRQIEAEAPGLQRPGEEPDLEPEEEAPSGSAHPGGGSLRGGQQLRDDHGVQRGDDLDVALPPRGPWGPPNPPDPDGVDLPNYSVWITPSGTRYHTTMSCPTLANTRRIAISRWCQACGRIRPNQRFSNVYVVSPGLDAHHDRNCLLVGLRMPTLYPCCQRCERLPLAVVGAQQLADRRRRG